MLKQTLVRAAMARSGNPATDRINRRRWGSWLTEIFSGQNATAPEIQLSGCVVSVLLLRAAEGSETKLSTATE